MLTPDFEQKSESEAENLNEFLYRNDLARRSDQILWTSLAGGVSSDIWRVDLPDKTICVKRALANLKVAADWSAPVERNNYEWEWFNFAYRNFPEIVPRPIAHDNELQMLAMEFLDPAKHTVWKTNLLNGVTDKNFAVQVGQYLGKIHAKSAFNEEIKKAFATDNLFFALRIEPYLLATADKHSDLSPQIKLIAQQTLSAKIALVHGDVSPKNILVGKDNPFFLDAETAWYGDPAFDVAFCLNHFLLKSVFRPQLSKSYLACFKVFAESYLNEVNWESSKEIESRIARLLPVLFLARVDGKSPVEYILDEKTKNIIRRSAQKMIQMMPSQLPAILQSLTI